MLTINHQKCSRGESCRQLGGYVRAKDRFGIVGNATCSDDDRIRPRSKSIRNAAHAFLPEKKSRRVFFTYPSNIQNQREAEFDALVRIWMRDTRLHSSLSKKFMHPAYQSIMAMGRDALPLIFKQLKNAPGHWFYALRFIAQKDVAESAKGFEEARTMWLVWGAKHHYTE